MNGKFQIKKQLRSKPKYGLLRGLIHSEDDIQRIFSLEKASELIYDNNQLLKDDLIYCCWYDDTDIQSSSYSGER